MQRASLDWAKSSPAQWLCQSFLVAFSHELKPFFCQKKNKKQKTKPHLDKATGTWRDKLWIHSHHWARRQTILFISCSKQNLPGRSWTPGYLTPPDIIHSFTFQLFGAAKDKESNNPSALKVLLQLLQFIKELCEITTHCAVTHWLIPAHTSTQRELWRRVPQ